MNRRSAFDYQSDLFDELSREGWLLLSLGDSTEVEAFFDISESLCRSFRPSIFRSEFNHLRNDGSVSFTPVGKKEILGHAERSYFELWRAPDLCFFYRLSPMPIGIHGGELVIARGSDLVDLLPIPFVDRLKEELLIYRMKWRPERWQMEFVSDQVDYVEKILLEKKISFYWSGNVLCLEWPFCPFRESWSSMRCEFSNGILAHLNYIPNDVPGFSQIYVNVDNGIFWENGESIDEADISSLINAYRRVSFCPNMRVGDVLILDNTRVLHGREAGSSEVGLETICKFGYMFDSF